MRRISPGRPGRRRRARSRSKGRDHLKAAIRGEHVDGGGGDRRRVQCGPTLLALMRTLKPCLRKKRSSRWARSPLATSPRSQVPPTRVRACCPGHEGRRAGESGHAVWGATNQRHRVCRRHRRRRVAGLEGARKPCWAYATTASCESAIARMRGEDELPRAVMGLRVRFKQGTKGPRDQGRGDYPSKRRLGRFGSLLVRVPDFLFGDFRRSGVAAVGCTMPIFLILFEEHRAAGFLHSCWRWMLNPSPREVEGGGRPSPPAATGGVAASTGPARRPPPLASEIDPSSASRF